MVSFFVCVFFSFFFGEGGGEGVGRRQSIPCPPQRGKGETAKALVHKVTYFILCHDLTLVLSYFNNDSYFDLRRKRLFSYTLFSYKPTFVHLCIEVTHVDLHHML